MGYRVKREIGEPSEPSAVGGAIGVAKLALLTERAFHPIPRLGACSQAIFHASLTHFMLRCTIRDYNVLFETRELVHFRFDCSIPCK